MVPQKPHGQNGRVEAFAARPSIWNASLAGGFRAEYVPRHAAAAVAVQGRAGSLTVYQTAMS